MNTDRMDLDWSFEPRRVLRKIKLCALGDLRGFILQGQKFHSDFKKSCGFGFLPTEAYPW